MSVANRNSVSGGNLLTWMAEGWNRFWFKPADPTTLGLVRICCVLLVVYVHLAYSFDLQTFFGRDAWIDSTAAEEFRHDVPIMPVATKWNDPGPTVDDIQADPAYFQRWGVARATT